MKRITIYCGILEAMVITEHEWYGKVVSNVHVMIDSAILFGNTNDVSGSGDRSQFGINLLKFDGRGWSNYTISIEIDMAVQTESIWIIFVVSGGPITVLCHYY